MSLNASPAVAATGVSFAFGDVQVLRNVGFSVVRGEYVGIIGPNGGGKTTLLNIMTGLLKAQQGNMQLFGRSPDDARRSGIIGYVPQGAAQSTRHVPATVEEIVRSGLGASSRQEDELERVDRALRQTDVFALRHRLLHALSGGQAQRVLIARALIAAPQLLILDEPATGVDAPSKQQFYDLLLSLNRDSGMTILFVTHDIAAIARDVHRVFCVNRTLCEHDSPKDFLEKHFLAGFLEQHV